MGLPGRPFPAPARSGQAMFDTANEYPPAQSAPWLASDATSTSRVPSDSAYWRMGGQDPSMGSTFPAYSSNVPLSQQNTWPGAASDQAPRDDYGWAGSQRAGAYPAQPAYSQYPSSTGPTLAGDSMGRGIHQSQVPYMRDYSQSAVMPSSIKGDAANQPSPISAAPQLPPFPAIQSNWQQNPASVGYSSKPSASMKQENVGPWYSSGGQMADGAHPVPYSQAPPLYGGVYYEDGRQ